MTQPPASDQPTTQPALPPSVGRYRILGRLGAGGMGTVYRALDPHLEREVAVKIPQLDGPGEQRRGRVERFQREARAAARILHPNVCPIYDLGEHDGAAFVVLAYIEGESLEDALTRRGRLDVPEAVSLIRQVLDALGAVHAQGIVHRDVKPGNILLDRAGRPWLTDFGLARPEQATPLTSDGVVLGTPLYMAPEMASGRADAVGPWTDLYALGVVFYQMLTGRTPFEGSTAAVLAAILRDDPPSPRTFRPDLDPMLEATVLRALDKDPGQRFRDTTEFLRALEGCPGGAASATQTMRLEPVAPASPEPPPAEPAAQNPWRRRLRWLPGALVGVGFGAGVAALVVIYFTNHQRDNFFIALMLVVVFGLPSLALALALWAWAEMTQVTEGLRGAARKGWTAGVLAAANNGVPLDDPDDLGETALMIAAGKGHLDSVKVLLLRGANTTLVNRFGQTAIEIAAMRGHQDIVSLLQRPHLPTKVESPASRPGPPPSARRWLVGSVLLGALLVAWSNWSLAFRLEAVDYQTMHEILRQKKAERFTHWREEGNVEYVVAGAGGKLYWTQVPPGFLFHPNEFQLPASPPGTGELPLRFPPPWRSLPFVLGVPVLLAAFVAWPVGRSWWLPILRTGAR